ncbi:hypothetical protein QTO01_09430 [Vibrio mytili]|nr:hypothetical protein [Vibrio mytili]
MNEKVRIPIITDTVVVNGQYREERRCSPDRRKKTTKKWRGYERRFHPDPRKRGFKSIDEEV